MSNENLIRKLAFVPNDKLQTCLDVLAIIMEDAIAKCYVDRSAPYPVTIMSACSDVVNHIQYMRELLSGKAIQPDLTKEPHIVPDLANQWKS